MVNMAMSDKFLRHLFDAAVAAADPIRVMAQYLPNIPLSPPSPEGRTVVVGFGKAAAQMAHALEDQWPSEHQDQHQGQRLDQLSGMVITRKGHGVPCRHIDVIEAAHPIPDARGEAAARRILNLAEDLKEDDLLLCLVSGGGSALCVVPVSDITLAEKQTVNDVLLRSGASISEMNCIRKHLSAIKGGRLASAAYPASVVTLAISDVPGDDPSVIASGPTVADPTSFADALKIVEQYKLSLPDSAQRYLEAGSIETPKPGDEQLSRSTYQLIATPMLSLNAAAQAAREQGIEPIILGDAIEGDAEMIGQKHAQEAIAAVKKAPCVLLSSGETTVKVCGTGRGGRNGQYALALAIALKRHAKISAIACDTDGIDGTEDNAGVIIRPDTLERAQDLGLNAEQVLADNDSYRYFEALGDLVVTGPTFTNVNDFRAILIQPPN